MYHYKPLRFYLIVFAVTWGFWISAVFMKDEFRYLSMLLGLFVPATTALITVLASKNAALKKDLRDKLFGAFRVKPKIVIAAIASFFAIIAASILLSTFAGQSLGQFSFTADFSFSISGMPSLITIGNTDLFNRE